MAPYNVSNSSLILFRMTAQLIFAEVCTRSTKKIFGLILLIMWVGWFKIGESMLIAYVNKAEYAVQT